MGSMRRNNCRFDLANSGNYMPDQTRLSSRHALIPSSPFAFFAFPRVAEKINSRSKNNFSHLLKIIARHQRRSIFSAFVPRHFPLFHSLLRPNLFTPSSLLPFSPRFARGQALREGEEGERRGGEVRLARAPQPAGRWFRWRLRPAHSRNPDRCFSSYRMNRGIRSGRYRNLP